ncbi:transmembrane protease serine 12-like [Ctenocephalides felis]|uniref:transmembrane protease serine 12-like n=1 Tax=Ctenocephalides felis TaxID=7515 RepID=UPI000E6E403A|nr:transmembrane protease serine 12-like [Ctenocephalides felis]
MYLYSMKELVSYTIAKGHDIWHYIKSLPYDVAFLELVDSIPSDFMVVLDLYDGQLDQLDVSNLRNMTLLGGQNNVHAPQRNPCSQKRYVEAAIRHENFTTKPITNDIRLIKVNKKFELTTYVNLIRVATAAENRNADAADLRAKCIVIGWGQTKQRNSSKAPAPYTRLKYLREVELPFVEFEQVQGARAKI